MASRRTPSTSGDNSPRCCDTKLQDLGLNCHKNVSRGWTLTTRSMGVVKGREGNLKCTKSDLVCRDSSSPHTCDIISLHWLSGLNRNILLSERNSSLLCVCVCVFSCFWLSATRKTCQAPLSMEFSRQEYWSELPFPTPSDLPDPGIEPESPALAGWFFTLCHLESLESLL